MKHFNIPRITFYLLFIATFWSDISTAQPCGSINTFSSTVTISSSQAPNTWYPDRYAPSGFSSPSNDIAGSSSLKETISISDGAANRPAGQQTAFYNTQGRRMDLISGAQSIEIKMYIPTAWGSSGKRMAGFWGEATDAGNANAKYPIVEFTSGTDADGTGARFRGWEDGSSTWVNLGLPAGFAYNSWVTIRMALSTITGQFTYTIGNITYTTTSVLPGSVKIGDVILQGHNYNPAQPIDETNTGVNYDIYWDDFVQSTQTDGLAGLKVRNINTGNYYCTIQSAINDASANDSITISPGSYSEQLTINKTLSFSGAGAGQCGTGSRPANETKLIAPVSPGSQLINLTGAITANFDGFEIDSTFITAVTQPNQNLGIRNSVFNLDFLPSQNNIGFASNNLTLVCNLFKAIKGTNNGASSHIFIYSGALTAINNTFTSVDAISSINATTTSLPVWLNITTNTNNVLVQNNLFTQIDIGILLAQNAGNISINNNEFDRAKRLSFSFGSGMGAGIAIFDNYTPAAPVSIKNNKFYNSETGIRTSMSGLNTGTELPDSTKLSIMYNSFENVNLAGGAAINIGSSYAGSTYRLNARCNWFGSVIGPVSSGSSNVGANGQLILDAGNRVSYKNWLIYGTDANAALGFQLPTALSVAPGNNVSQAENHYRILSNAIGCVTTGQTLTLSGTFDFSNATAQAEWAKGNNGIAGDGVGTATGAGDDYTITAPDSANNVTITATALNNAILQGPGDLSNVSLETPLFLNSNKSISSYKNWTISNLVFNDFDLSLMADNNGGPIDVMNNFTVTNNTFRIPADLNTVAAPADNFQNIGIVINQGKNQTISNNTIYMDGTGVSDAGGASSSTVALQSATSGGDAYDGLKIINNSVHVTGVPSATPAKIVGFWENSNNQTASIELSGNTFVNDNAANLAANNKQLAFRVTSFSGDVNHQVVYKNNEITGYNRGISFIGDPFSQYGPNPYFAGETPVVIINNKIDKYKVGVSVIKDAGSSNNGSPAIINNNSFTHVVAGGFAISNESSGLPTAATCNYYDTLLVGNIINGSVTYLPKLSNGTDADPSTTGFQVDPATNPCVSPVLIVRNGATYTTIQAAVDAAIAGDSIVVSEGIYPENVVVNKALKITGKDSALVIVDKGDGNYLDNINNIGFSITANNVSLKKMKVRNYGVGVRANAAVSTIALDSMSLIENYDYGFYTRVSLDSLVIKNSTLSYNGFKNGIRSYNAGRGIFTQALGAGDFSRFNIHDNLAEHNSLTGIDVNSSNSTSGVTIQNNVSRYNFDEQIGVWLGNTSETMGAVLVKGNTMVLSDSAHYGMEVRMPHGTSLESGNGSVLIQGNNISVVNHTGSVRDMAAIGIIRRKDGFGPPTIANDQPQGVVIKDNVISNFQNAYPGATSGSAFGIVVGGIAHRISGNNISNTQISIQLQKGNENAANNNTSGSPAVPNNEYFDRDNSSDACAEIGANTITGSSAPRVVTGPSTVSSTLPVQYVTNFTTMTKFCTIQSAINFATTTNGNIIDAAANTYTENVTVSKSLTIQGPNQANNPNTGSRVAEAIVVPGVNNITDGRVFNVTANNVTIKGFTIDGDNTSIAGGTALNGAEINAATGIGTGLYPSIDGSSNLLVENNILRNFDNNNSSTAAIYGNGSQSVAITGNVFRNNKISNSNIWGILTESNYYASIQNNVIDSANRGIQIDGFFIAAGGPTPISGNTVGYYKRGITVNNNFSGATQFTVSDNTIAPRNSGTNENGGTGAPAVNRGIAVWTMYNTVGSIALANNKITGAGYGMELWNIAPGKVSSTGDSVLNSTDVGILLPTQQATYGSGLNGSFATITQATINGSANDGIRVTDNDGATGTAAKLNLTNSFVTGGVNNIVIVGPEIDASTLINNNSLTGASAESIDASAYTGGAAINATCNWFGGPSGGFIASRVTGNVNYLPALLSGVDADPATKGFQPAAACTSTPAKTLYVNDNSNTGNVYTTAIGDDGNNGTPSAPFATIGHAVNIALAGDTIYVDPGTYVDTTSNISIVIDKKVNIFGPNYGVNPSAWANDPATLYPRVSDPDPNTGYSLIYMPPAASGSRIDGLVFDGDNTTLNGVGIDAVGMIQAYEGLSNVTVQNNKIQNFSDVGITFYNYYNSGAVTSGNLIYQNKFDNILSASSGVGVLIYNNCYTSIINNTMTGVSVGVQTGNFYQADTSSFHSISKNKIQSQVLGIWTNLHYNSASTYDVSFDTLTNFASATPVQSMGIRVQSIQSNTGVNVSYNNITGNKYGVGLSNCPTTNTIRVKGGTITGTDVGVWATNSFNTNNRNGASSSFIVDSVNILNATYAGIEVTDSSLTTNNSTVALAITDKDTINNTTTGLLLQGANASASFTGATPAAFKNQAKYIDQISNGATVPNTNIDATLVSFDSQLGSAMSLTDLYNTEDKINHKIDLGTLGFVLVKANNDYVTPLSFIAPATTTPKIQRGVDAASNGFNVNVKHGTYAENVLVNKSVAVLGAQVGQPANPRFLGFTLMKADPTTETIVTAPVDNPLNGNPNANDLFRVTANNVTIDGLTIDGNNTALSGSFTGEGGTIINARRGITNIDANDNFNPVNNLAIQNNVIQNISQRGISLNNNGPVSTGNTITSNVIRSFGADPVNGGQAVILFNNAYANITGNTIIVPHDQIGLHLQNFYADGTMTWSGNNVTVGQNGFGIHANNFYAPAGVLNISGNTVNAATGVTGTSDSTWGINVWSIQSGSTVNVTNNNVGNLGGSGTFARGINLWSMPTSNMVTVSGGSIANAVVGVNLDNVDLFFGAGSNTMTKVTGTTITASQSGVRARAASLATPPSGGSNTVSGSVSLTLDNVPINVSGTIAKGVLVNAPAASSSYMATLYLTNNTAVNNTTTSDTAVLISGNQAQLVAATSNIKVGSGAHNAIQFNNITSGNTVSNLILAGGTTINLNSNNAAKAFASPQYSIVEVDAAAGWTAPDSAANGNQSILIDGAMRFTNGVLSAGNSTIEFGTDAPDIMTNANPVVVPEKNISYILGNAKMLSRPVGNAALDMLGVRLAAQGDPGANVGNMDILRTTRLAPPINPPFPGNNSILTTWGINPSNTSSSRSDVQFRYLSNTTNLNGQNPSSIYSYRYVGGQWTKVSSALNSIQVGDVYTTASFGVPGFSPWTLSSQSSTSLPDLTSGVITDATVYDNATPSRDNVIRITNRGTGATTAPIQFALFKLASDFTFTVGANTTTVAVNGGTSVQNSSFTIQDMGGYYLFTSNAGVVIAPNASIRVGFNITKTGNAGALGTISIVVLPGTGGGETPTDNNNNDTNISIN